MFACAAATRDAFHDILMSCPHFRMQLLPRSARFKSTRYKQPGLTVRFRPSKVSQFWTEKRANVVGPGQLRNADSRISKNSMAIITSFSKHVALSLNVKDQRSTNLPMRWNSHVQHKKSTKWNANIPAWTANQSSCAVWFMGFARCVFVRHHVRMRPVSQEQYHNLTCTKHAYL